MKQTAVALNSELIKIMDGMKPKLSRISGKAVNNRSDILRVFIDYFSKLDDTGKMVDQAKWIFDPESEPTNDQIYALLKNNDDPKLARYLFLTFGSRSEYRKDKAFIFLQMADPESPFYLEYVADALRCLIEVKNAKDELQSLRNKLQNAKDEIEEAEETISHLNEEITDLEQRKAEIEAEIKQYNDDMVKIITFKPIDALQTLNKALADIVDYMDATDPLKAKLRVARDLVGKLVQHVDRFSVPDELTAIMKAKIELTESIRKIEDKDVRKLFLRLMKKIGEIKPANTFNMGLLENAGYYAMDPNTYYDISDLAGKISSVLEEVKK